MIFCILFVYDNQLSVCDPGLCHRDGVKRRSYLSSLGSMSDISHDNQEADPVSEYPLLWLTYIIQISNDLITSVGRETRRTSAAINLDPENVGSDVSDLMIIRSDHRLIKVVFHEVRR